MRAPEPPTGWPRATAPPPGVLRDRASRNLDGHDLGAPPPRCPGADGTPVALESEFVLCSAGDAVPLGQDLGGLPQGMGAVALLHPRVDEAPPEGGVVHD